MKKHVKYFILLSSMLSLASQTAILSVNAGVSENFLEENFSDYIKLEENDLNTFFNGQWEAVYMNSSQNGAATFYFVEAYPDTIEFTTSSSLDADYIEQLIKSVDDKFILKYSLNPHADEYVCTITYKNESGKYDRICKESVIKIHDLLSEYSNNFNYKYDRYVYNYSVYEYITAYKTSDYDFSVEEKLNEYLENNEIAASFLKYSDGETDKFGNTLHEETFYIVPDNSLTITAHYELAKDIAEKTGIKPYGVTPTGVDEKTLSEVVVSVTAYTEGDTNCDGSKNLADSVLIMQSLANPSKYVVSSQGSFNADIIGNDGITNKDALTIQRQLLGLE